MNKTCNFIAIIVCKLTSSAPNVTYFVCTSMIEILNCSKVVLRSQQSYSSQLQLNRSRDVGMECLTFVLVQEPNEVFSSLGQSNHNGRGMGRISPVIKYSAALIYAINNAEKPLVFFKNVIVHY